MNHLHVSASYEPGQVAVTKLRSEVDGLPFAVIAFGTYSGASLSVRVKSLAQINDLYAALDQAREYLTDQAARDAA